MARLTPASFSSAFFDALGFDPSSAAVQIIPGLPRPEQRAWHKVTLVTTVVFRKDTFLQLKVAEIMGGFPAFSGALFPWCVWAHLSLAALYLLWLHALVAPVSLLPAAHSTLIS